MWMRNIIFNSYGINLRITTWGRQPLKRTPMNDPSSWHLCVCPSPLEWARLTHYYWRKYYRNNRRFYLRYSVTRSEETQMPCYMPCEMVHVLRIEGDL